MHAINLYRFVERCRFFLPFLFTFCISYAHSDQHSAVCLWTLGRRTRIGEQIRGERGEEKKKEGRREETRRPKKRRYQKKKDGGRRRQEEEDRRKQKKDEEREKEENTKLWLSSKGRSRTTLQKARLWKKLNKQTNKQTNKKLRFGFVDKILFSHLLRAHTISSTFMSYSVFFIFFKNNFYPQLTIFVSSCSGCHSSTG